MIKGEGMVEFTEIIGPPRHVSYELTEDAEHNITATIDPPITEGKKFILWLAQDSIIHMQADAGGCAHNLDVPMSVRRPTK